MRKVLMPIGDASETVDTLYPFFRIKEEGYEVVVAGPEARRYAMVLHEVPQNAAVKWDITEERSGYHIQATAAFHEINPDEFDALFVSGGRAPEYIRYNEDLLRLVRHFFEHGKPVGVVCHGIEVLSAAGVIQGRRATTVGKCALDVEQGGGVYIDQPVVVDGNLVSTRTWHDYDQCFPEFIRLLKQYTERGGH